MGIGAISSQLLLDIADFIYITVDINQKVTLINKKGCEILGYSEDEIIGKNWFDNFLSKEVAEDIRSDFVKQITENKETRLSKIYPILTKEGEEKLISWCSIFFNDEEGNLSGVLCSGEDITKYTRIEKMLKKNEKKFRKTFNHSNDGYILRKLDGTILDVNPKFLELFGYNRDEVISKNIKEIRTQEDPKELSRLIRKVGIEGFLQVETEARKKDGAIFPIELNGITFDLEGERVVFNIIRDLTESKKSEASLIESEKKYSTLLESLPQKIYHKDVNLKYVSCNENYSKELYIQPSEIKGKTDFDFFSIELAKKYRADDKRIITEGKIETKEEKYIQEGEDYTIEATKNPIYDENGECVGIIGIIHDVSNRVKDEQTLQEKEKKFRILFNEMKQAYALYELIYDKKGEQVDEIIVEVNPEYEKLVNKKREEIIGEKISEIFPKTQKQKATSRNLLGETVKTGKTVTLEYYNENLNKWLLAKSFSPLKDHVAVLFEDITIKRRMEVDLEKERKATKQYLDIANIILTVIDANENVILVNKKGCELLGYEQKEMIGKKWFDNFLPERVREKAIETFRELLTGKLTQSESHENLILTKDGEESLIAWDNTFIRDEEGTIVAILSSGKDITEMRKAQEELEESEKLANTILNHTFQLTGILNPEGRLLKSNQTALDFGELKEEDVIGKFIWDTYWWSHSEEERVRIQKNIKRASKGEIIQEEITNIDKYGNIRTMDFSMKPIIDNEGVVASFIIEGQDITEKKIVDSKLLKSEQMFKSIFNYSNDGYVLRTVEGEIIEANPRFLEIFGYERSEVISADIRTINTYETQEDHQRINKEIEERGFIQFEAITTRKDGSLFPIDVDAVKLLIGSEEVVFVIIRDITKRKKIEEKIKSSEALYRELFENTGTGMILTDEDLTITLVNKLVLELSGFSIDEILGKKLTDFVQKEERENILKAIKGMGTDFIPPLSFETSEFSILGKNKNLLVTIGIIPETKQHIVSLIDNTEQKRVEKELRESEEKYRELFYNSSIGLLQNKPNGEIVTCNTALVKIFGYKNVEEIKKVHVKELYFDSEERKQVLEKHGKESYYYNPLLKTKKKDGSHFWVELYSRAFFDENNNVTHYDTSLLDVTEKKINEELLVESEERLRNLFENIPLAISINSSKGELIDVNPAFWKLFGYNNKEECLSAPFTGRWFNIRDCERLYNSLLQRNFVNNFEAKRYKKDGNEFWGSVTAIAQIDTSGERVYYTTLRNITTKKQKEDELKRQILRYYLEESHLYLSEEERPYISKEAFSDLLKVGYNGLVLSRLPETDWKKDINYEFDFFRIAEKGHLKTISSELSNIEQLIEELPSKHVIVIDRLDYLIAKNGFETTLFFIFRLMDIVYLSNHIIIVALDPAIINEKERKLLRKEMRMIESIAEAPLPEELIEILEFVHKRNIMGEKPSYTDIVEAFNISRPTARKRIKNLINEEYIFELTKGRSKVLGITAKGKAIFD